MTSTTEILTRHLTCFGAGDLDGILADYAPDALIFTPYGVIKGTDAIKPFFKMVLAEFGKPGTSIEMKQQSIEGDYAYIVWAAETADNVYEFATDTFVVRNGRIAAQSFAAKIVPKR